ncbi:MAG: DUF6206 family protein [Anaerolineales bacterium]
MTINQELILHNPAGIVIEPALLQEFERGLDPLHPDKSKIACHVLGYGEISTVFEIQAEGLGELAFKRMCAFRTEEELQSYLATFIEYNRRLEGDIGLHLPPHGYASFVCEAGYPVFYIIQKKLAPVSISSKALHHLVPQEAAALFQAVLGELNKVWEYNRIHPAAQVGIDGQLSNWAIEGFDPYHPGLPEQITLFYIDTSTPISTQGDVEQMDPELFLRSAPPYLVWILRLLFVKDVMARYYDPRKVIIDIIANFYKEQKPELIPNMVACANDFITRQGPDFDLLPITEKEVKDYYREDEIIWSMYLSMRRFDRFVRRKVLQRDYPYILPGKIKR